MLLVWRNKRAEEKRALEWENQKLKDVEMIRQKVQNDYEKEIRVGKDYLLSENGNRNVKDICSPKLLYEMLENTNDPEGLKVILNLFFSFQLKIELGSYKSSSHAIISACPTSKVITLIN